MSMISLPLAGFKGTWDKSPAGNRETFMALLSAPPGTPTPCSVLWQEEFQLLWAGKWKRSALSSDGTVECGTFALTLVILFPAPCCESRNGLAVIWFTKTSSLQPLPVSIVFDSLEITVVQLLHSFLPGWAKLITRGHPLQNSGDFQKKKKNNSGPFGLRGSKFLSAPPPICHPSKPSTYPSFIPEEHYFYGQKTVM